MGKDRTAKSGDVQELPSAWKQAFRRKLQAWYAKHARVLPWRESHDPYRVWLSEVMLQQTQVDTVRPYFEKFTTRFPTVFELAKADEQEVLRMWEGLGYYRRARGLHAAAQKVVAEHGGEFPCDLPTLLDLPGVGRYTAGAIRSIAFGLPAPILEANTIRLLTRLIAYDGDPTSSRGQKRLWGVAEELLPRKQVAAFNQGLMELGSLVCTPRQPSCEQCPVATLCEANQQGLVDSLQPTTKKLKFTDVREAAVVVRHGKKILIRQCGPGERWAGMWDFPRFAVQNEGPLFAQQEIASQVAELTGVRCEVGPLFSTIKHGVTRYRITLDCYEAVRIGGRLKSVADAPAEWATMASLADRPLSVTGRKIANGLRSKRRA